MRMRTKSSSNKVPILITPLIDCVFLLLIFFLVTSIIKRYERLIPITLADSSASVATEVHEDVYQLAMDRTGGLLSESGKGHWGSIEFEPVGDANAFFSKLSQERGVARPVQVRVEPGTPFQTVIHLQDLLELQGFQNFRFRISDRGDEISWSEK